MIFNIYKITCSHCLKMYVGSTKKTPKQRLQKHKSARTTKTRKLYKLTKHMCEVGCNKFTVELIEEIDVKTNEDRFKRENHFILEYDTIVSGFNCRCAHVSDNIKKIRKRISDKKYRESHKPQYNIYRKAHRAKQPKDKYVCECCDYKTPRLDTYKRHLRGSRHKNKAS